MSSSEKYNDNHTVRTGTGRPQEYSYKDLGVVAWGYLHEYLTKNIRPGSAEPNQAFGSASDGGRIRRGVPRA
jgi:hypothetical protein